MLDPLPSDNTLALADAEVSRYTADNLLLEREDGPSQQAGRKFVAIDLDEHLLMRFGRARKVDQSHSGGRNQNGKGDKTLGAKGQLQAD